jgi:hypothetical protein
MSVEADKGNWDDDFRPREEKAAQTDQKKTEWMRFDGPGQYRVRLCGNYVKFYRWWSPFTTRIITHLSWKDQDPAWKAGFWPRKTFAIHVIDRSDTDDAHPTGKLKILEKGNSIFSAFADYRKVNDINPAGKDGPDFVIEVTWPDGNKRQAKYKVTAVAKPSPWSADEVAMIKEEHVPLKEIYKTTPLETIIEEWEELPDSAKTPPQRDGESNDPSVAQETRTASAPVIEESMHAAPANAEEEDDLFGDDSTEF